jgi:hypothetical protein
MEYFRLRPAELEPEVVDARPVNRAGDLVFVLLHDMAVTRSLALGELPVRRRMEELGVRVEDCDTLGGNLATIAAHGAQTAEDREILCFYFALGLKGRLQKARGPLRQRTLMQLRETLDFLSGVFGTRVLSNVEILGIEERQMLWDLLGGTVLALAREQTVPGVDLAGGLMRWVSLFALAPRNDRLLVARTLLGGGLTGAGRLTLVGLLDPVADADLLARAILPPRTGEGPVVELALLEGPEPEVDPALWDGLDAGDADPADSLEANAALDFPGDPAESESTAMAPSAPGDGASAAEVYEVSGRAVTVRTSGRRLLARLTGWALAERAMQAFGAVFLGIRREGALRLTRKGLVYDETLWMLGRAARRRTVAIPMESMAARLDRRHNVGTLLVGLAAAVGAAFLGTLWMLDGFRSGYWPFLLLAGGLICGGLVVDLLLFRITGRLRGQSQLVLDGGEGTRIRLDGVRRAEAEALLTALAGPSRFAGVDDD